MNVEYRETYTIRGKAEEFECPQCGCPMCSGDRAVADDRMGTSFCSMKCSNIARAFSGEDDR